MQNFNIHLQYLQVVLQKLYENNTVLIMVSIQSNAVKEKVDYPRTVFIIAVAEDRLWHPAGKGVRSIPGKFRVAKTLRITGKIFRKCLRLERVKLASSHLTGVN